MKRALLAVLVKAVVLAGGEGTRLRPLTFSTPKQMLPVAGRPVIERVVEELARHGVDEVVLSLGYRPDAFIAAYPGGTCAGVALKYAVEESPLDTAGAIAFAAREGGVESGTFITMNADVLSEIDVTALVEFHRTRGAEATIALTPVEDPSFFGVVPVDESGRVKAFIEKPPAHLAPTNMINAGVYVLEPSFLRRVPTGRRVSVEREVFPALAAEGRLYALGSEALWTDMGTPAKYLEANLAWAKREGPSPGTARVLTRAPTSSTASCTLMPGSKKGLSSTKLCSSKAPTYRLGRACTARSWAETWSWGQARWSTTSRSSVMAGSSAPATS